MAEDESAVHENLYDSDADPKEDETVAAKKTVAWCRSYVDKELGQTGVNPKNAWKLIYRAIMWTETANDENGSEVIPHIIDKDRMLTKEGKPKCGRPKRKPGEAETESAGVWYPKAVAVGDRLCAELGLSSRQELPQALGLVHRGRKPDQNTTSATFETLLGELVNRYLQQASQKPIRYCAKPTVDEVREYFRGYRFARSRSEAPKPDLVVPLSDPMAILSLKWSMRDDHISQMIGEAVKVHSVRPDVAIFAVTNEFDLRRLLSLANDPQIQRVYHVNMALLNEAHRPRSWNQDLIETRRDVETVRYVLANHKLRDLSELFTDMLMVLPAEQRAAWAKLHPVT